MRWDAPNDFSANGLPFLEYRSLLAQNLPSTVPTVLVGGTNGKGTTAAHLAASLSKQGLRTGLFMSPHLIWPEERLLIDGAYATSRELQNICDTLQSRLTLSHLNYFQFLTLLAHSYFTQNAVEIAVLEVGLGGRLDPTNATNPIAAVITSIDLDHMAQLGDSRSKILQEKLPIARTGRPLYFCETAAELRQQAAQWAEPQQIPLIEVDIQKGAQPTPLIQAAVPTLLNTLGRTAKKPIITPSFQLPGRWQRLENIVIDIAHNDAALTQLAQQAVVQGLAPYRLIIAQPQSHPWSSGLSAIAKPADYVYCPVLASENGTRDPYFVDGNDLAQRLRQQTGRPAEACTLHNALVACRNYPTVICGSARLAGKALRGLGVDTLGTPLYIV